MDRRDFLKWMGASLALAGISGCRGAFIPQQSIVPYVRQPEGIVPGESLIYRTALKQNGFLMGVEVACREGRPIKVEGNPHHPSSLGGIDSASLASTLTFYDPDRSTQVERNGTPSTWNTFHAALSQQMGTGEGVRILLGNDTSPTLARQLEALRAAFPGVVWHRYDPVNVDAAAEAARVAFGSPMVPLHRMDRVERVLGIEWDFLPPAFGGFADARRLIDRAPEDRRMYSVEPAPTLFGSVADHRRSLPPSQIVRLAAEIASGRSDDPWTSAAMRDLDSHSERAVVACGWFQPPEVHAAVQAANARLGSVGNGVRFVPLPPGLGESRASLASLVQDMAAGRVRVLLIFGANPAYSSDQAEAFRDALARVPFTARHGLYFDETSSICDWHLPASHEFEHWSDGLALDGTASIVQPLILPLHDSRSVHEVLATVMGKAPDGLSIVRETWRPKLDDPGWTRALEHGLVDGSAPTPISPAPRSPWTAGTAPQGVSGSALEVVLRPDPSISQDSLANNGWLQELPKPHTGVCWSNAVQLAPKTFAALGLKEGDVVSLAAGNRSVEGPAIAVEGMAEDTALLHLGFGRRQIGVVGKGVGFDAYPLVGVATASVSPTGRHYGFAVPQRLLEPLGGDVIRSAETGEKVPIPPVSDTSLYNLTREWAEKAGRPQWGMSVDLTKCIGCNACVVACQAENNIPVVGPDHVRRGRIMHWIRIDRYRNPGDDTRTVYQPMLCQHCETAPCEPVCPVGATVHSHEGLNQMVYNRCIGTRYCSNNCPYKVRRFNWMEFDRLQPNFRGRGDLKMLSLLANPEVTVRSRGVMEKCSYCVQRLEAAKLRAQNEHRDVRDGDAVPACAQACPTRAIVFGDIADPDSAVRRSKASPLNYAVLAELNTIPRTTYLTRVWNSNSEVGGSS